MRRGLVDDDEQARLAIADGRVTIDGAPALKPTTQVDPAAALVVADPPPPFVSRGGEKLAGGLDRFGIEVHGRLCLDAGASTGGFTDCLLQRGAAHVTAVDVGYGDLHHALRVDERVTLLERTNVRDLVPEDLQPPPGLVVADLSFISLTAVLPVLRAVARDDATAVLLVKPQFEAPRGDVGDGGVVRDPRVWTSVLRRVVEAAQAVGWQPVGVVPSPLVGPAGNVEFLVHLQPSVEPPAEPGAPDLETLVRDAVDEARDR